MRTTSLVVLASSLLALVACGGDPSIVATWRELPNAFDEDQVPAEARDTWTFSENGVVTVMEQGEVTDTATYTLDGDQLTLTIQEPDETLVVRTTVVLTDDRLMYGVLSPAGDVDGPVGDWEGSVAINDLTVTQRVTLQQNGSASLTQTVTGETPRTRSGTWERRGDSLRMVFVESEGSTFTFRAHLLEGDGIGGPLLERL